LGGLGEIFQTKNGCLGLTQATKNWPEQAQNFLTQTHHYMEQLLHCLSDLDANLCCIASLIAKIAWC